MKVKHLVWKNHTSFSIILGYDVYNIVSSYCCGEWSGVYADHHTLLSFMPLGFIICVYVFFLCDDVCFEVTLAIWLSDQQKYLKCMFKEQNPL